MTMRALLSFCAVLVCALWVDAVYFGGMYSNAADSLLRQIVGHYR